MCAAQKTPQQIRHLRTLRRANPTLGAAAPHKSDTWGCRAAQIRHLEPPRHTNPTLGQPRPDKSDNWGSKRGETGRRTLQVSNPAGDRPPSVQSAWKNTSKCPIHPENQLQVSNPPSDPTLGAPGGGDTNPSLTGPQIRFCKILLVTKSFTFENES